MARYPDKRPRGLSAPDARFAGFSPRIDERLFSAARVLPGAVPSGSGLGSREASTLGGTEPRKGEGPSWRARRPNGSRDRTRHGVVGRGDRFLLRPDPWRGGARRCPLRARRIVGLLLFLASAILRSNQRDAVPDMMRQIEEEFDDHPKHRGYRGMAAEGDGPFAGAPFVALVPRERLRRLLGRMLDEGEFLSRFGLRSLSKRRAADPVSLPRGDEKFEIHDVPGEGDSDAFGGNSNWRGPVWFPIDLLVVIGLRRAHLLCGEDVQVERPTGSGVLMSRDAAATQLARRLVGLFLPDADGHRPCHGGEERSATDPHWRDLLLFNEYFHGDTGRGIGASHQTGWTAAVTTPIREIRGPASPCKGIG